MPWQVSIIFFFVFVTIFSLYRRSFAQKTTLPGYSSVALAYVTAVIPMGVIVGLSIGNLSIDWSKTTIISLVVMAAFIALFNWFAFQSSKKLSVATFLTILQIYTLVAVILGWLVLGETLIKVQLIGGVLLLIGAVLAAQSYKSSEHELKKTKVSAVLMAVLAGIALGSGIVAEKSALGGISIGAYFIVGFSAQTLAICLIAIKDLINLEWSKLKKSDWTGVFTYGVTSTLVGFFFIATVTSTDNVALVATLTSFQLPLGALAGYLFLKERDGGLLLGVSVVIAFTGLLIAAM